MRKKKKREVRKKTKTKEENQKRNKEAKEENGKPCALYTLVLSSTQAGSLFSLFFSLISGERILVDLDKKKVSKIDEKKMRSTKKDKNQRRKPKKKRKKK